MSEADASSVVAADDSDGVQLCLRRRGEVLELVVDGVFAMDSAEVATERELARAALARCGRVERVLVGGLGLGFTVAEVLADSRVVGVQVVELHAALVRWWQQGLLPQPADVRADPRLQVLTGDVLDVVPTLPAGGLDALLLDVDNGPGFLVHLANAALYQGPFLAVAARALRPGGMLAVWSADPSPGLRRALERSCGPTEELLIPVLRQGRELRYAVYLSRARCSVAAAGSAGCPG